MDMETTLSTALACITNNGTAFGDISGGNFSIFSGFGKLYSAILMLAGRLELYAIVILFSRSFWNSDRARS
jgi:trk system potassium uptake protein TrkH